jgi:hypothetical protein
MELKDIQPINVLSFGFNIYYFDEGGAPWTSQNPVFLSSVVTFLGYCDGTPELLCCMK